MASSDGGFVNASIPGVFDVLSVVQVSSQSSLSLMWTAYRFLWHRGRGVLAYPESKCGISK